MHDTPQAYGLWSVVILNSVLFIFFGFTFFKPRTARDWRSFGAFSAFLVALFTEMYGFPLTIYLVLPWLQRQFPGVNWLTHDSGHLLEAMVGWRGNPHFGPFHILSDVFIGGGFWLLASSWPPLYQAQKENRLADSGPYAKIRHPQYVAFVVVMFGFLLQWPTILTLAMFPILVFMYWRLALAEERDSLAAFGDRYTAYVRATPAFIPHLFPRPEVRPDAGARVRILTPKEDTHVVDR
jgi:protein-S-isoprenylcysteine O-methyltransferase Ste14